MPIEATRVVCAMCIMCVVCVVCAMCVVCVVCRVCGVLCVVQCPQRPRHSARKNHGTVPANTTAQCPQTPRHSARKNRGRVPANPRHSAREPAAQCLRNRGTVPAKPRHIARETAQAWLQGPPGPRLPTPGAVGQIGQDSRRLEVRGAGRAIVDAGAFYRPVGRVQIRARFYCVFFGGIFSAPELNSGPVS
jgi:hypothetical protein